MAKQNAKYKLLYNSRFYIVSSTILISVFIACFARVSIVSDQLFYIRLEQLYGLAAILYWYAAVIISPLGYMVGKERLGHLAFARRAVGVSAAYFAFLHFAIALWGQLGGLAEILQLPGLFKWSLAFGGIALLILLIMAATSFDKIIKQMTFRRWKWLHRLVYAGLILVIIHIWMIGTHITYSNVRIASFILLVILAGLESFRLVVLFTRHHTQYKPAEYFAAFFVSLWVLWIALILVLPEVVPSYHQKNHKGTGHTYIVPDIRGV